MDKEDEDITILAGCFMMPILLPMTFLAVLQRWTNHIVAEMIGKTPPDDTWADYIP